MRQAVNGRVFLSALMVFGQELRRAGLRIGTGQLVVLARAATRIDPADKLDLYWAGRTCLTSRKEDIAIYDAVFTATFEESVLLPVSVDDQCTDSVGLRASARTPTLAYRAKPLNTSGGKLASDVDVLREKDFSHCSDEELAAIARLLARVSTSAPFRRVRRTRPARRGVRPDLRRELRELLRHGTATRTTRWRQRQIRSRVVVLLLDVSGSMSDYSRALLQFAYVMLSGPGHVEVFCFGTRLTRVSDALARRSADDALRFASNAVVDWNGGTRIGESLHEYVRTFGRRAGHRRAVVIICSDGLERGEPEQLAREMSRLSRLAYRIIWVNPLKGDATFQPISRGMQAALPSVDYLVSGHNLASLQELALLVDTLG